MTLGREASCFARAEVVSRVKTRAVYVVEAERAVKERGECAAHVDTKDLSRRLTLNDGDALGASAANDENLLPL